MGQLVGHVHKNIAKMVDMPSIEILNDDCLLLIFEYLPLKDKIKIEAVCKRWQRLSSSIWWNYKILVSDHIIGDYPSGMVKSIEYSTFKQTSKKCARHITTLDLSCVIPQDRKHPISLADVREIFENCPNIQALYLVQWFEDSHLKNLRVIDYLKPFWSQLTKFGYFYNYSVIPNEDLFKILTEMTKLKHLYIDSAFCGRFLEYLPKDIEELIMENCGRISFKAVCESLRNTKIHTLCSSGLVMEDKINLPEKCHIRNLAVTMTHMADNPNWAASISQFVNIEKLNVEMNDNIDDSFLNALSDNCKKINFLNIGGCSLVTDAGTVNFKSMPKLRYLAISGLVNVTGKSLGRLSNLEVLDCSKSENISDDALYEIVWNASQLRFLIINNCKLITNNLLKIAINATLRRKNSVILNVDMLSTKINLKKLRRKSPMLKVYRSISHVLECGSHYNPYFPTIDDFYMDRDIESNFTRIMVEKKE